VPPHRPSVEAGSAPVSPQPRPAAPPQICFPSLGPRQNYRLPTPSRRSSSRVPSRTIARSGDVSGLLQKPNRNPKGAVAT
jgi:hypothetical protein